jgi:TetR/AcrR family transcriptional regulator, transcriptional repressor for nem operon
MASRDRLTSAMASLMWERGYAATSPKDVLDRAGVGQGSMYHYFSGKHELAVEALSASIEAAIGSSRALEGDGDPMERIARYLAEPRPGTRGCRVGRMTQDPEVVADPELLGLVRDAFETAGRRWEHAIAEAVDAGELPRTVVPAELALTLQAVIQGGYVLARAHGSQEPMDAAIRGALTLLDAARGSVPAGQVASPTE